MQTKYLLKLKYIVGIISPKIIFSPKEYFPSNYFAFGRRRTLEDNVIECM